MKFYVNLVLPTTERVILWTIFRVFFLIQFLASILALILIFLVSRVVKRIMKLTDEPELPENW